MILGGFRDLVGAVEEGITGGVVSPVISGCGLVGDCGEMGGGGSGREETGRTWEVKDRSFGGIGEMGREI